MAEMHGGKYTRPACRIIHARQINAVRGILFKSINAFMGCFFHKSVIKLTHNGAAYPRDNLSQQQEQ